VQWLQAFLAAGGGQYVNVIGYHFYVMPDPPEAMVPLIAEVRQVMQQGGVALMPLWDTETGWQTPNPFPSEELEAAYVVRAYVLAWLSGAQRFYWYAWDNHTWVSLPLTELDNKTPTLAGQAYGTIQTWMGGAVAKELTLDSSGSWIVEQQRGGVTQWIVWDPYGLAQIDLTYFPGADTVTPLSGSPSPLSGTSLDVSEIPELVSTTEP
jgi:hypothetical protein